jgi:hypothetical protein
MVEIIGQYVNPQEAATHALNLVTKFLLKENHEKREITKKYTPNSDSSLRAAKSTALAIAVFDIDDTLLHDLTHQPSRSGVIPNVAIVQLAKRLYDINVEVHLITARLDCKEMREASIHEMNELGIKYHSLTLAPPSARRNMTSVSKWKMSTRMSIARQDENNPIALTVGDQWGDMVVLKNDDAIDHLDEKYRAYTCPYILMRPGDGVSLWGLKLPAK